MLQEVSGNIGNIRTDFPLINAVLLGKQSGKIFRSDSVLFVLHKSGFCFLQTVHGFNAYKCLIETILNLRNVPTYLHFYNPPQEFIDECSTSNLLNIKVRKRVHFRFERRILIEVTGSGLEGYALHKISGQNFESLSVFNLDLADKFWSSKEDFLTNGFGFFVSTESKMPVALCYTACIANGETEIDIVTLKNFQNRGLAKFALRKFIQYCIDKPIIPNWDCFADNSSSLFLAKRLAFEEVLEYNFLSLYIKN